MDDLEDPAVRRHRGLDPQEIGDDTLTPEQFYGMWMTQAGEQSPETLGTFLTHFVAAAQATGYEAHRGSYLAVGMRAVMAALERTVPPDSIGPADEAQALAILHVTQWLGWPTPRAT